MRIDSPIAGGQPGIDPASSDEARRQFRTALGQFATGVTAMTTVAPDGTPVGITVSSFNSLSLEPPLILWGLGRFGGSFHCFQTGTAFAVNVLCASHHEVARKLAQLGDGKFDGIELHPGLDAVPLITGSAAHFECTVEARYPGGDHDIVVGRVRRVFNSGGPPLLFFRGALHAWEATSS